MKTNDELEVAVQNLIERVNRVEASVAHKSVTITVDPLRDTIQAAMSMLDNTIRQLEASRTSYQDLIKRAVNGK